MAKQSPEDRRRRLSSGGCPVHGIGMCQVGHAEVDGVTRFLVECPRLDCDIQATASDANGPLVLLPRFSDLLAGAD